MSNIPSISLELYFPDRSIQRSERVAGRRVSVFGSCGCRDKVRDMFVQQGRESGGTGYGATSRDSLHPDTEELVFEPVPVPARRSVSGPSALTALLNNCSAGP
jgi:hypothetical protein